jgi:hypothetical protein
MFLGHKCPMINVKLSLYLSDHQTINIHVDMEAQLHVFIMHPYM